MRDAKLPYPADNETLGLWPVLEDGLRNLLAGPQGTLCGGEMMPVTVDIDQFDDDEILDEVYHRGLLAPLNEGDLLELMGNLGIPEEVQKPVKEWLSTPVADDTKLNQWVKAST